MMNDLRKEKIAEKVWLSAAKKIRLNMKSELEAIPSHQFCDKKATLLFGHHFWKKVEGCSYDDPSSLTKVLESINSSNAEESVYWLHRNTNDAGMLNVKLSEVIVSIVNENQIYNEDILIAAKDCMYGVCFEVGEDGPWLRHWGITI